MRAIRRTWFSASETERRGLLSVLGERGFARLEQVTRETDALLRKARIRRRVDMLMRAKRARSRAIELLRLKSPPPPPGVIK